jgi:hypothetical protein
LGQAQAVKKMAITQDFLARLKRATNRRGAMLAKTTKTEQADTITPR